MAVQLSLLSSVRWTCSPEMGALVMEFVRTPVTVVASEKSPVAELTISDVGSVTVAEVVLVDAVS
jgi:hypothetical protein